MTKLRVAEHENYIYLEHDDMDALIWEEVSPEVWEESFDDSRTLKMSKKDALRYITTFKHILWRIYKKDNP